MSAARLYAAAALLAAGFLAVLARLACLQLVHGGEHAKEAEAVVRRIQLIDAPRGRILDCKGRVLAEDAAVSELWVEPGKAARILEDREGAARLHGVLRGAGFPDSLRGLEAIARSRGRPDIPRRWLEGLPYGAVYWLACRYEEYPGLSVERSSRRRYPHGAAAAHLLGQLGRLDDRDLERLRREGREMGALISRRGRAEALLDDEVRQAAYLPDDLVGRGGVEGMAEEALRGRRGIRVVSLDLVKGVQREETQIEPAIPGTDIRLTIDLDLQQAAEHALGRRAGAVVALDPRTGDLLAMASAPSYDMHEYRQRYMALAKAPGHPLLNRALRGEYPPGSIFKLVTASAMLDLGLVSPATPFVCEGTFWDGGTRYRCHVAHGHVDMAQALEHSCNCYFFHGGRRLGIRALSARARALGFGAVTGLSLGGQELGGSIPGSGVVNMAVGQGALLATPLQAACLAGAFANGGRPVRPGILPGQGSVAADPSVSPGAMEAIREGLRLVVRTGTAAGSGLAELGAAGKTGTAEVEGREPHAWFIAYAPDDAPGIALAVLIEHGGAGGDVAAPAAAEVIRAWQQVGN